MSLIFGTNHISLFGNMVFNKSSKPLFSWVNLDFGATVARSFLFDK